jgi:hypothetical protein
MVQLLYRFGSEMNRRFGLWEPSDNRSIHQPFVSSKRLHNDEFHRQLHGRVASTAGLPLLTFQILQPTHIA